MDGWTENDLGNMMRARSSPLPVGGRGRWIDKARPIRCSNGKEGMEGG